MLRSFVEWITSSESRPFIKLQYKDLEALTERLIGEGDKKNLAEIRKELVFRKFTKVSHLIEKIDKYLAVCQESEDHSRPPTKTSTNKETKRKAKEEKPSEAEDAGRSRSLGVHIKRVVSYKLIEEDSEALFIPVRDESGIIIRINKGNPIGLMVYKEITSKKDKEPCLLGLLIEALVEYEIEEVGRARIDVARLRRAIGKKLIMRTEY